MTVSTIQTQTPLQQSVGTLFADHVVESIISSQLQPPLSNTEVTQLAVLHENLTDLANFCVRAENVVVVN